jgi:hypothetical protein
MKEKKTEFNSIEQSVALNDDKIRKTKRNIKQG